MFNIYCKHQNEDDGDDHDVHVHVDDDNHDETDYNENQQVYDQKELTQSLTRKEEIERGGTTRYLEPL